MPAVALCSFEGLRRAVSRIFPVALARGKHLFPFRTEQLSPSAPMVLGPRGPGRVGRRRFLVCGPPSGGPFCFRPTAALKPSSANGAPNAPSGVSRAGCEPRVAPRRAAASPSNAHQRFGRRAAPCGLLGTRRDDLSLAGPALRPPPSPPSRQTVGNGSRTVPPALKSVLTTERTARAALARTNRSNASPSPALLLTWQRAWIHGRDADLRRGLGLARPLPRPALSTLAQRRPAWTSAGWLAPVDLPVDAVVALEREERAGEPVRGERALCECECPQ